MSSIMTNLKNNLAIEIMQSLIKTQSVPLYTLIYNYFLLFTVNTVGSDALQVWYSNGPQPYSCCMVQNFKDEYRTILSVTIVTRFE